MSEDRYTQLLGDYVDGTLSEGDRGLLESHLAVCESCRPLAADLLRDEDGLQPLAGRVDARCDACGAAADDCQVVHK